MLLRTTMALALVLTSASGALAAQKKQSNDNAYRAFASSPVTAQTKQHSTNPAFDVYNVRGHYLGSDPDPTVRAQISRDSAAD